AGPAALADAGDAPVGPGDRHLPRRDRRSGGGGVSQVDGGRPGHTRVGADLGRPRGRSVPPTRADQGPPLHGIRYFGSIIPRNSLRPSANVRLLPTPLFDPSFA